MLAELPRKNCWTIAEHAGQSTPDAMQHLLGRACWDTDGVGEDLREFVVEYLGDRDGMLVVDLCRPRDYAELAIGGGHERRPGVGFWPQPAARRSA